MSKIKLSISNKEFKALFKSIDSISDTVYIPVETPSVPQPIITKL